MIDTHAHLDQVHDLDNALKRAHEHGLSDIVAMSVDLASMKSTQRIAFESKLVRVHAALGIHPGKVKNDDHTEALSYLKEQVKTVKVIGETGLDYWYKWVRDNKEERRLQQESFAIHLELARQYDLPIVIHSRGAWRDCLSMTKQAQVKKALFHWYSGPLDILDEIIAAGYFVSTSPSVGYSPQSQEAMARAPLERILIETDCPVVYRDEQGQYTAEPKDVFKTLKSLASLRACDADNLSRQLIRNAQEFFQI